MMTSDLRDELTRLGDDAPQVDLPPDLWRRGRRARRRDRIAAGAAVVALLAGLGGAAATITVGQDRTAPLAPATSATDGGGVPSMIHLPPAHLVETDDSGVARWDERMAETDLGIGTASAAFLVEGMTLPMVVTAADGVHHALELPGWLGAQPVAEDLDGSRALALSPDGRSLAYGWWEQDGDEVDSGVRILDLSDGTLRSVPVDEGEVWATTMVWSPDSRWLAWAGDRVDLDEGRVIVLGRTGARVAPEAETNEPFSFRPGSLSIDSDGTVTSLAGAKTSRWEGDEVATAWGPAPQFGPVAATSPDGSSVLLGNLEQVEAATFLDPVTRRTTGRELAKDTGLYREGADVHPLGWIDDTLAVALVSPYGDLTLPDDAQLVVMSAPSVPEESWTYRIVGHVDTSEASSYVPLSVSVAVDLMTLAEPTRDFTEPEWAWDIGATYRTAALLAGLSALLVALPLLWWRRRPV